MARSLMQKISGILSNSHPTRRILEAVNRTSGSYFVKFFKTLAYIPSKVKRISLAKKIQLSTEEKIIVKNLFQCGYSKINNVLSSEVLIALEKESMDRQQRSSEIDKLQSNTRKDFWIRLLDQEKGTPAWNLDNAFIRPALSEVVVKIISSYFGEIPYLVSALLTLSKHTEGPYKISQLWHQDRDDVKIIKLFIYLTDVNDNDHGPFTFMPKQESAKVSRIFPNDLTDDEISTYTGKNKEIKVLGGKLTAFLVDTHNCYHMGSRLAPGHSRLMYTATFISTPPIYPNFENKISINKKVNELENLVLRY